MSYAEIICCVSSTGRVESLLKKEVEQLWFTGGRIIT